MEATPYFAKDAHGGLWEFLSTNLIWIQSTRVILYMYFKKLKKAFF